MAADILDCVWHMTSMSRVGSRFFDIFTIAAAMVVASGVAAAVLSVLMGSIQLFTLIFLVVCFVSFILGMPVYLVVRATRNETPVLAAVTGFIVGAALPAIVVLTGPAADLASSGGVATVIDGAYTMAGWRGNLTMVGFFGLLGVGCALLFRLIVRRSAPGDERSGRVSPARPLKTAMLAAAAAGVITAAFAIPYVTADRSCHNTLRNGARSITPVASFGLRVGMDQWRTVEQEVKAFQSSGEWLIRGDIQADEGFPGLLITLCTEPGTQITVRGISDWNEVRFSVYQPQGGSSWKQDFQGLYNRISARWPKEIFFPDGEGGDASTPEWAASSHQSER